MTTRQKQKEANVTTTTATREATTENTADAQKADAQKTGNPKQADTQEKVSQMKPTAGHISFVGAGPGDARLLTVRAAELLAEADVVVIETPEHANLVTTDAQIVDVGRQDQPMTPSARNRAVLKHAKNGAHVVRLFVGDPFTYSSGPEEAAATAKAGISFEVVPGLSSATAVPAYAGVPLTSKDNSDFSIVEVGDSKVDWSAHAEGRTLVLLDALDRLKEASESLIEAGRDAKTPAALTRVGTTTEQSTVVTNLESLAEHGKDVEGPAVVVIGRVVDLRDALSWFETKPLYGWRVLVPRTREQGEGLAARLRGYGAHSEQVPTISVEPPRNPQQMAKAVRGLVEGRYEWIAFTSVNAVKAVREKFEEYGLDARAFSGLKVAAVGDKTAQSLMDWGIRADLVPSGEQSARGLVEDWPPYDDVLDPINRVFLPRADIATEVLVAGLTELGWEVDDITAYRTVRAAPPPAPTREAIKTGKFDAVLFTSSSTVRNLVGIAGKPHATTVIACIGPATVKTAEEHGLRVDVMAEKPSVEVLADALAGFGAERRQKLIDEGKPVTKPSQRKTSSRRKS